MNHSHISTGTGIALATLLTLGGCLEPTAGDDSSSVEQFSFITDLGVALGNAVATNNTSGLSNDYHPTCVANSAAPNAVYTWTAPAPGIYTFSTTGSSFDTVLEVRDHTSGASLGCNDDSNGTLQSTVNVGLSSDQMVTVVVDGYGANSGSFQLNINGTSSNSSFHLWLRGDRGVITSAGQVSAWLDQSSNGRNASMSVASRQPAFVSNALNGEPLLRFNGGQSLNIGPVSQPTNFSVFIAGKNSLTSDSFSMILGPGGSSPNNQLRWDNGSQALFVTQNPQTIISSTIGDTRVYHALSATYDSSTINFYRDGVWKSSSNFTTSSPWTIASIGSWYSSFFMTGDLAEVIIYDRALSDPERATVNAYLRGKYALP